MGFRGNSMITACLSKIDYLGGLKSQRYSYFSQLHGWSVALNAFFFVQIPSVSRHMAQENQEFLYCKLAISHGPGIVTSHGPRMATSHGPVMVTYHGPGIVTSHRPGIVTSRGPGIVTSHGPGIVASRTRRTGHSDISRTGYRHISQTE